MRRQVNLTKIILTAEGIRGKTVRRVLEADMPWTTLLTHLDLTYPYRDINSLSGDLMNNQLSSKFDGILGSVEVREVTPEDKGLLEIFMSYISALPPKFERKPGEHLTRIPYYFHPEFDKSLHFKILKHYEKLTNATKYLTNEYVRHFRHERRTNVLNVFVDTYNRIAKGLPVLVTEQELVKLVHTGLFNAEQVRKTDKYTEVIVAFRGKGFEIGDEVVVTVKTYHPNTPNAHHVFDVYYSGSSEFGNKLSVQHFRIDSHNFTFGTVYKTDVKKAYRRPSGTKEVLKITERLFDVDHYIQELIAYITYFERTGTGGDFA